MIGPSARRLGPLLALLVVLAGLWPGTGAAGAAAQPGEAVIELVAQTPMVQPGGRVDFEVRLDGVPDDGFVQVELHHRIRSRSEFDRSVDGEGLRPLITAGSPIRVAELPTDPGGVRTVPLLLDPSAPGGIALTSAGTYPVRLRVTGPDTSTLATVLSHVVVVDAGDESPRLAVAVLAELSAPPALRPDGGISLDERAVDELGRLASALAAVGETPLTLAINPETVDSLAADGDPDGVLDALRSIAEEHLVLGTPYTPVSPDALARATVPEELDRSLERGRGVLADELGAEPRTDTWVAEPDLGAAGLSAIVDAGFVNVLLDDDQLEPAPPAPLSLAKRFTVRGPAAETSVEAPSGAELPSRGVTAIGFQLDDELGARLDADDSPPGLVAQRVVSELAVIWMEQPAEARGAVLRVDRDSDPDVVVRVLDGLAAGGLFTPVTLPELFESVAPLRDPSGAEITRVLRPEPVTLFDRELVALLAYGRAHAAGYAALVGADSPRPLPLDAQLLLATSRQVREADRARHVEAVLTEVGELLDSVRVPEQPRITLTSREATIPLTVQNDAGFSLDVVVHLDSQKLEFPLGEAIPVTLDEATSRLDFAVRTLATGTFPLDVRITSPDGSLELASTRYSVQSTAVSGVGLLISAGAGIFLLAWWLSHWRRARRSRRLVPLGDEGAPQVG